MALQVTGISWCQPNNYTGSHSLQLGNFLQTNILAIIFALVSVTGGLISLLLNLPLRNNYSPGSNFSLITILIKFLNNKFS